jgi:enamine deaminase RidA (YjgF/YER057c/UK114 family)
MPLEKLNPEGLSKSANYSQVVSASAGRVVFVAGQVALDAEGELVGKGDLGAQARQAYRNVATALNAAGADVTDVTKITTFVVEYDPDLRESIGQARREAFGDHLPASTLVGVQALALPEYLIEVEAIAVLD